jgi:hypothetical protein
VLTRPADKAKEGQETISRVGLGISTLDSEGNLVLCRPSTTSRDVIEQSISDGFAKRKSDENSEEADKRELKKLKLPDLQYTANAEGVVLGVGKITRAVLIKAICDKRECSRQSPNVSVNPVVDAMESSEKELMEKRVLNTLTLPELQSLAVKENVKVTGKKTKTTYVNAIYLARNSA